MIQAGNFRCSDRWLDIGRRRTGKKLKRLRTRFIPSRALKQGRLGWVQGAGHCLPLLGHLRPLPPRRQLRRGLGLHHRLLHDDDTLAPVPWTWLWKELQPGIGFGETQELSFSLAFPRKIISEYLSRITQEPKSQSNKRAPASGMALQRLWQDFHVWRGSEQPQKEEPWLMSFAILFTLSRQ